MADSISSQIQASIATQVGVTATTGIVKVFTGDKQVVTQYPVAYVWAGIEDDELLDTDLNTYDDWRETYQVTVEAKDPEQVRLVIQKLQGLFKPFTSANALYALGVTRIRPRLKTLPSAHDPSSNEDYAGRIVFELDVRYTY